MLIAKIAAVVYLAAAVGALCNRDLYRRVLDDMFKNAALTYFMGFTAAILGCLIVNYHNIWVKDWTVLITIIGWLALIKGVLLVAFPRFVQSYSMPIFAGKGLEFFPFVAALLGLFFGYLGFVY